MADDNKPAFYPPPSHRLHSSISHPVLRSWQCRGADEHHPADFILPIFILNRGGSNGGSSGSGDGDGPAQGDEEPIATMPGVSRMSVNRCLTFLKPLIEEYSLSSVLLFPIMDTMEGIENVPDKATDPEKFLAYCTDPDRNAALRLIPLLKKSFPSLLIVCDVCLCTFSPDGHCAVYRHTDSDSVPGTDSQQIDNRSTINLLAGISLAYARAGCDVIAPSDMMDGRVGRIRDELHRADLDRVSIMSYSAKFASCLYGPFRDAAGSAPAFGDRKCYQLPPGAGRGIALRAVERDLAEGADQVMVKPGLPYLDVVSEIRRQFPRVPVVVYHVSGEYAQLIAGYRAGAIADLPTAVLEQMTCIKRAGGSVIITYFTPQILQWIARPRKSK